MINAAKYAQPEYRRFDTSPEILQALEEYYPDTMLDGDRLGAFGAWEFPSDFERSAIVDRAFELTTQNVLQWGIELVNRPAVQEAPCEA